MIATFTIQMAVTDNDDTEGDQTVDLVLDIAVRACQRHGVLTDPDYGARDHSRLPITMDPADAASDSVGGFA